MGNVVPVPQHGGTLRDMHLWKTQPVPWGTVMPHGRSESCGRESFHTLPPEHSRMESFHTIFLDRDNVPDGPESFDTLPPEWTGLSSVVYGGRLRNLEGHGKEVGPSLSRRPVKDSFADATKRGLLPASATDAIKWKSEAGCMNPRPAPPCCPPRGEVGGRAFRSVLDRAPTPVRTRRARSPVPSGGDGPQLQPHAAVAPVLLPRCPRLELSPERPVEQPWNSTKRGANRIKMHDAILSRHIISQQLDLASDPDPFYPFCGCRKPWGC